MTTPKIFDLEYCDASKYNWREKHVWRVNAFQFYLMEINKKNKITHTERVQHTITLNTIDDYFVTVVRTDYFVTVVQTNNTW
jgi:hypothetical protein